MNRVLERGWGGWGGGGWEGEEDFQFTALHVLELKERGVCLFPEDHQLPKGRSSVALGTQ